jgi:DNA-binding transcriptional LysR family regulator
MRPLPPFPELVAFEAVARHLSFTKAAQELCVTQSAVSHRVRRLEKYFSRQLIRRLNPGLALTDAGAALLPELVATLDGLARIGRRSGRREHRLRVAAGSALCTWWLAGRLASFMKQRPGISIELIPIENEASEIPEVDVRILWTDSDVETPSPAQAPLFTELVFPVCSPRLLPRKQPLSDAGALATLTLLHKATGTTGEWSWSNWFERLGVDPGTRRGGELRFADMGLVLAAAVDGSGVAISRSLLVHDALRSGSLIVPITNFEPMISKKKHVARWRREQADDPDINLFVTWLIAEAALTLANTSEMIRTPSASSALHSTDALNRSMTATG